MNVVRELAALKLGWVSARRAKTLGLPFNAALGAYNVFEIPVDLAVIETALGLYREHIVPRLATEAGAFRSGDLAFYVKRPPWSSDIAWWSADDELTYGHMEARLFKKLDLRPFHRLLDLGRAPRLYCPFFVVRSRCERTNFHKDYDWGLGTNAYTLMTPLEDMSAKPEGHLAYLDTWGRRRVYRYRLGTAVVLGAGFIHGTEVVNGPPRAFLCFTFGSDKEQYASAVQGNIGYQSRLLCRPGGQLVRS